MAGAASSSSDEKMVLRLGEQNVRPFDLGDVRTPPVIIVHAPRGSGLTTLIGSILIQGQQKLGLEGVVIVCDRPSHNYMNNIVARDVITNKPVDKVLEALIEIQSHRIGMELQTPLPRVAIAVDDALYSDKMLKSEEFQCNLRRAKDYNIMVIIGTSNVSVLSKTVYTCATHVFATRCLASEDPKHLQKRLFVMFENGKKFAEVLSACRPYEFLVGLMSPLDAIGTSLQDYSRTYVAKLYGTNTGTSNVWLPSPESEGSSVSDADSDSGAAARNRIGNNSASASSVVTPASFVMSTDFIAHVSMTLSRLSA